MAQVILNLEPDEILRAFTTGAKNEGLRLLLQKGLNAMLDRESSEQPGATRYKRTEERTDSRNGVRPQGVLEKRRKPLLFSAKVL